MTPERDTPEHPDSVGVTATADASSHTPRACGIETRKVTTATLGCWTRTQAVKATTRRPQSTTPRASMIGDCLRGQPNSSALVIVTAHSIARQPYERCVNRFNYGSSHQSSAGRVASRTPNDHVLLETGIVRLFRTGQTTESTVDSPGPQSVVTVTSPEYVLTSACQRQCTSPGPVT